MDIKSLEDRIKSKAEGKLKSVVKAIEDNVIFEFEDAFGLHPFQNDADLIGAWNEFKRKLTEKNKPRVEAHCLNKFIESVERYDREVEQKGE